mgnify:CR=1 FL=1
MLEVVHLTKIYKAKGGVETKALNDVSVRFPEKGMVFLLGKSGSGKSTLLNVCGGLDSPTSGEIIVKGRSSKNFSQSDFDSYRNTFIGFVFQEYNILNEFTVEDNIALALELQGKPKDKKAIKQLLDDVDLSSFAKRKPNTLSGGQKQRIAIARALIKHPEIIMADEPTGALDSATGKQVFDTLKKLSKTKLVIVVSHDRDFAEEYGDRIIELKDGRILSDVTKEEAAAKALGANLEIIGENTLSVKDGAALTQQDYQYIYAFLSRNKNAIISGGEKEISDFKKVSHITENGGKEFFAQTDEKKIPKKQYDGKKTKFIRSKLPMRHAFRIGVSGLKSKPFRLIFTILLCSVAFIMFGLFSTLMLYDKDETLYQTLNDAGVNVLHVDKVYKYTETYTYTNDGETNSYSYDRAAHTRITDAEAEKIAKTFGEETFGVTTLLAPDSYSSDFQAKAVTLNDVNLVDAGKYYSAELLYAGYLPENHAFRNRVKFGTYPAADDEILISSYTASVLVKANYENVASAGQLLGKTISFTLYYNGFSQTATYKISGVFDSGDKALYEQYKTYGEKTSQAVSTEEIKQQAKDLQNLSAALTDGYHEIAFFNENTATAFRTATKLQSLALRNELNEAHYHRAAFAKKDGEEDSGYHEEWTYLKSSLLPDVGSTVWLNGKTAVSDGEAVITPAMFARLLRLLTDIDFSSFWQDVAAEYTGSSFIPAQWTMQDWLLSQQQGGNDPEEVIAAYEKFLTLTGTGGKYEAQAKQFKFVNESFEIPSVLAGYDATANDWANLAANGQTQIFDSEKNSYVDIIFTEAQVKEIVSAVYEKYAAAFGSGDIAFDVQVLVSGKDGWKRAGEAKTFKVAGFVFDSEKNYSDGLFFATEADCNALYKTFESYAQANNQYFSSTTYTFYYEEPADAKYDAVFLPYSSAHRYDLSMFSYDFGEDYTRFAIGNAQTQALELVNSLVQELSEIFMWIGIVLAAFSMLLLSNFIATSISYKKKEIGILRAVGARGADVFKIFYSESFVIALICLALGIAGSVVGCNILNREISTTISASIFVFGGASVAILLAIAAVTSAIATFLPVFTAARKKPVEAIRAL